MNREELAMEETRLSESDICAKYITPALHQAGWDEAQIRREVSFTKGRIIVRGRLVSRGEGKRADYVLHCKPNLPIAVIEAKDNITRLVMACNRLSTMPRRCIPLLFFLPTVRALYSTTGPA